MLRILNAIGFIGHYFYILKNKVMEGLIHMENLLGEIIGDSVQDELITQLFSQFCLGK